MSAAYYYQLLRDGQPAAVLATFGCLFLAAVFGFWLGNKRSVSPLPELVIDQATYAQSAKAKILKYLQTVCRENICRCRLMIELNIM